jgi:type I restriction enzyme S subunit
MSTRWPKAKLCDVVDRVTEKNKRLLDRVLTVSATKGLIPQESYFSKRVASANLSNYLVVAPGTFVYNKSYSEAAPYGVATFNSSPEEGVVSPLYFAFKPKIDIAINRFLEYALDCQEFHRQLTDHIKQGGRAHGGINVSVSDYLSLSIPLPAISEQKRIVDVVSSVDAYIDALHQQADSARVARKAVLHELLSAGGDDWSETTLGEVADVLPGFPFRSDLFSESDGIPLIRIRDLPSRRTTKAFYTGVFDEAYIVNSGEFLIGMDGEFRCYEWIGESALLNQRVCKLHNFRLEKVEPRLVYLAIDAFLSEIEENTGFTTVKHISIKQIRSIEFKFPPLEEQQRIVNIVSSMDEVIQSTEHAVNQAKCLRAGLLSDLLSGEHEIPESYDRFLGAA